MVNGRVDCHAIKIGRKTGFPLKIFDGAEELDKNFLNNIKGILSLSHHAISNPVDLLMILIEDLLEGVLITPLNES
jgi:hypothetical protein